MAVINTVATLASFVLVASASTVALVAYMFASGRPRLEVQLSIEDPEIPQIYFEAAHESGQITNPPLLRIKKKPQTSVVIRLENHSTFAARNPGIRVELIGLANFQAPSYWKVIEEREWGVTCIQWDGGADDPVHRRWTQQIEGFDLGDTKEISRKPAIKVTALADRATPRARTISVFVLEPDLWELYQEKMRKRLLRDLDKHFKSTGRKARLRKLLNRV
ncbi:hypothetical protein GCM10009760_25760 [Kitasatospora kazusensis]|uniref:SRPBCC family protein n=2 Tax=Kitasatospora kazusensis TaxID=407974 RepID=A0ABN2ZFN0_9ACTN